MSTFTRRLGYLYVGLFLFGLSVALLVQARLGLAPWDVFHQGLSDRTGIPIDTVGIFVGVVVLLLWIPLGQRPGLGTVSNVIMVGLVIDGVLLVLPEPDPMAARVTFMLGAILLNGVATALYIGARLGPGPRDGLMTGLAARGYSVRAARTVIELTVLTLGWLLGGTVGVGTALYALCIGPLVHMLLPRLTVTDKVAA